MSIEGAFDRSVEYYDNWMKLALPSYDEIFATTLELIPFDSDKAIEVLDLGAGTGLFSEHIFKKYPQAKFTLYDLAPKMLDVARERFREHPGQFDYLVQDYRELDSENRYDLVISSLSIHHLEDERKAPAFQASIPGFEGHGGLHQRGPDQRPHAGDAKTLLGELVENGQGEGSHRRSDSGQHPATAGIR